MSTSTVQIFVSSGEASGDLHAASVAERMTARRGDLRFRGIGGARMAAAGVHLTQSIEQLGALGFVEVIRTIPRHARLLAAVRHDFAHTDYRLAVLVDYPGFHLRLARIAAKQRIPVLYYIPPQLWAWGAWRAATVRESVQHVASILPFERDFFARLGVPTTFVGHPLLDRTPISRRDARAQLGISMQTPVVALFPGSRRTEIRRLWPTFRATALRLRESIRGLTVIVAGVPGEDYPGAESFSVVRSKSDIVMAAADVALCKSGTTTLEAALARTPFCVAYRVHPATYALARRLTTCQHIGLVNLLLRRSVVPEFVQEAASVPAITRNMLPLFDRHGRAAATQLEAFEEARQALGTPGVAVRVADLALELASCTA